VITGQILNAITTVQLDASYGVYGNPLPAPAPPPLPNPEAAPVKRSRCAPSSSFSPSSARGESTFL
jgi:hypothetical protein